MRKTFILIVVLVAASFITSFAYAAGITIPLGVTLNVNTTTVNVPGDVTIAGILQVSSGAITLTGDWSNSGTFTKGTSTVTLNGTSQSISGTTTFYGLTKEVTTAHTLTFEATKTQTVSNSLTLNGALANLLSIRSSIADTQAALTLEAGGSQSLSYLDVKDNNALGGLTLAAGTTSTNSENNSNWTFGAVTTKYWVGTNGSDWDNNDNWSVSSGGGGGAVYPQAGDTAIFDGSDTDGCTLDANVSVEVIDIRLGYTGLNAKLDANTHDIAVSSTLDVDDGELKLGAGSDLSVTGALTVAGGTLDAAGGTIDADSTVTVSSGTLLAPNNTFNVAGNFTIASGATFTKGTGTLIFDGDLNYADNTSPQQDIGAVEIGTSPDTTTLTTNKTASSLVINEGDTLVTDGWDLIISGDITVNGTLDASSGTGGDTIIQVGGDWIIGPNGTVIGGNPKMTLTKDANKKEVNVGEVITYTITIENNTLVSFTSDVTIEDTIPGGFKYIDDSAQLDGSSISNPTGNRPLSFNVGTMDKDATKTLRYQLVVGSGVTFGKYENTAVAKNSTGGTVVSNTATETVKVIPDPLFDLGTVIGKVFWDLNENGIQDAPRHNSPIIAETGIANVRIVTEDGTVIITDKDGKYHVPGIIPGRHAFRLDESTLPEGAYLTTPKVVIEDVRPGLTSKVNFGVSSDQKSEVRSSEVTIIQDREMPKPRLNVALNKDALEVCNIGGLKEAATFRIFTNYSLFIDKWQLDVFDKATGRVFKRFKGERQALSKPIYWNGTNDAGSFIRPGRSYAYVVTVWDKQGKFDKTGEREFRASRPTPQATSKKGELEEEIFGSTKEKEDEEKFWLAESRANNLDTQTITLAGETVKVISQVSEVRSIKIMREGKLVGEIPVVQEKIIAKELLERPQFEAQPETQPIEIIVPNGEYEVRVMGSVIASPSEARAKQSQEIASAAPAGLPRNDTMTEGKIYSKHIKVGEDYFFFIAMADGEMGYNFRSGNTEPIEPNDRFKNGLWLEGKLAYYLKAKIKGKYFITSSLDTERDQKELFRYIDPDKYYPVYGDNSQISYKATNTQGMLYALIEWDRSKVMWGNYNVAFTDTEFAQFSRTLYGGKAQLISTSDTKFGEPNTKIITFMAKAKQKAAHNEFIGTGGSLYYLKHKYVVEGSDKVKIEVRDKITGLVITSAEQKEGPDYQIDYDNGRIIFWKPVSQIVASDSIISSQLLDGNQLYVVADYEYYTKDKYDEWSKGARVSQQIGDYLRIGGTYVQDENQAKKNYELYGADTTVRLGDNIRFDAEYAETKSEEGNNFISTDGGLSFNELATSETAKGKAYGLKGEAKLFDRLGLSGYYKKSEKGFSTPSSIANQGTEKIGGAVSFDILPQTTISARHDIQKLLDDGSLEARAQVGAEKTETTTVQLQSQLTEKLQATAEYRRQSVSGKKDEYESETNEDTNIVAGKLSYKLNDKTTVSARYQESLGGEKNRQGAVGVEAMLTEHIGVRGEGILGSKGNAATAGVTANVQDRFDLFADYTLSNEKAAGLERTATIGGKAKVDDKSSLYNTYSVTDSGKGEKKETLAFGAKKELENGYEITMGREFSKEGTKLASANTYGVAREVAGRRIESTFKQEESFESDGSKFLTNIFGLSGDINDKWAGTFNLEKGEVQNLDGTRTKRIAVSGGAGYVNKDKIKASSKLEFRHDDSSAASQDSWQILAYNAIEAKATEDLTLFAKANVSYTQNSDSDSTMASFKEMVAGAAYRPIYHDKLNLIGKYSFLEDDSPASQADFKDIDHIRAHVFGLEAVYDLTDKFQIVEKGAFRYMDEKVSGFGFTNTETWLLVNRLNYNLNKDWEIGAEYRILNVVQAKDLKQGALLEVSRRIGEFIKVGAGYNFTDFSDDLTDLDYTMHSPFVRMTGVLYDRTPQEVERLRKKQEEENIKKWVRELVHDELARPESEIMKELYNHFYLAKLAHDEGRLKDAKELYEKIREAGKRMYEEAEEYVRGRVQLEKELKSYNELAKIYYKEGKLIKAKELWQRIIIEAKQEVLR